MNGFLFILLIGLLTCFIILRKKKLMDVGSIVFDQVDLQSLSALRAKVESKEEIWFFWLLRWKDDLVNALIDRGKTALLEEIDDTWLTRLKRIHDSARRQSCDSIHEYTSRLPEGDQKYVEIYLLADESLDQKFLREFYKPPHLTKSEPRQSLPKDAFSPIDFTGTKQADGPSLAP